MKLSDYVGSVEPPEEPLRTFKFLSAADLRLLPPLRWRIQGVLPADGFAAIYGPSGSGKGFLVLHFIAAVAEGVECFGHRTNTGRVFYVVLEGQAGIPNRVAAWEQDTERSFPTSVRFLFEQFRLTSSKDVLGLAASIGSAGGADIIVIDTLNRAAPEADENSAQDMGRLLECMKELQSMVGGLVLLVHHTGKVVSNGMRGHSSVGAALDAVLEVSRTDDRREWKVAKAKDGEDGQAHAFRLRVVDLGHDENGEPVNSCVIDVDLADGPALSTPPIPKAGGNQKIVFDALGPLLRNAVTRGKAGAPAIRPCLTLEDAIAGVKDRLPVDVKRRKERAESAIRGLVSSGVLACNEGWIWLP